nr:unnamed protein product [Callosobruchus chinensis]
MLVQTYAAYTYRTALGCCRVDVRRSLYSQLKNMAVFLRHGVFKTGQLISSKNFTSQRSPVFRPFFITKCCTCFLTRLLSTVSGCSTLLRHESREEERSGPKSRPENRLHSPIFGRQRVPTAAKGLHTTKRHKKIAGLHLPNRPWSCKR